jgi:hypothetical protein
MRPLVVVHDLNSGVRGVELKMRDAKLAVELEVPKPAGNEPEAQRFRAPDLVWTRWRNGSAEDWGFLVLIQFRIPWSDRSIFTTGCNDLT